MGDNGDTVCFSFSQPVSRDRGGARSLAIDRERRSIKYAMDTI